MFYIEPGYQQRGRGVFNVDRYPLQRGRGLGGIFANLLRKVIPFGKSFVRTAAVSGKKFIKSDLGKEILSDTIDSAASAAVSALLQENPTEAKEIMKNSLKRSHEKSKKVATKIAKDKLDQVLIGKGSKGKILRIKRRYIHPGKRKLTLLDM